MKRWSELEIEALKMNYNGVYAKDLAIETGRSVRAIIQKAIKLGLKSNLRDKGNSKNTYKGYISVKDPHRLDSKKTYILKHRFVMEKHIGRKLKKSEVVHHINGNIRNNNLNNLMLFPNQKAHTTFHHRLKGNFKMNKEEKRIYMQKYYQQHSKRRPRKTRPQNKRFK